MLVVPLSRIKVPADRQRGAPTLEAVNALADSIRENGLLNPLTVREDPADPSSYILIAGETRLRALSRLEFDGEPYRHGDSSLACDTVPVVLFSELSPLEQFRMELEENLRRTALPWQQLTAATAKLAELKAATGLTARPLLAAVEEDVAALRGTTIRALGEVHKDILLGQHLSDPEIAKAKSRDEAVKLLTHKLRKEADVRTAASLATAPNSSLYTLIQADCLDYLATVPPGTFDAILCDPPYGIGMKPRSEARGSSEHEYDDSFETFEDLMTAVIPELARVLKPDAAGYLFCAFENFGYLQTWLEDAGFEVWKRPFIWSRGEDGHFPDPEKWPRRSYECIVFFRRGTRPLFTRKGDSFVFPANRDSANYHGAKKPVPLLVDLLGRICRPGDHILDFCAGSGMTVHAALQMKVFCTAIEKDPSYFGLMQRLLTAAPPAAPEIDL